MRYAIGAALAILVGAGCNLDGPDEATTDALVQADKADAIAAARHAARSAAFSTVDGSPGP